MPEQLDILVHSSEFTEETRAQLAFSDATKIRLSHKRNVVELKQASTGTYPTTADIHVISPLFQPSAVRQWVGFQAFIQHKFDGPTKLTGDGFRLHDGTNQYFWNGSAWVINTTSWNTEAEVASNIATFSVTAKKIRVVVNLTTTDNRFTPKLSMLKLAWKAKIHYLEDIIYRSLVPALRGIRFITDFGFKVLFPGGTALNVGKPVDDAGIPFNLKDADSIFDHTTDPAHNTNKLSSFNLATRIATLSSAIPVGNTAFAQLVVEPEVAVEHTSGDFVEVEKAPAITITDIEAVDSVPLSQDDHVVNKSDGSTFHIRAPYRFNLRFTMIALAPGAVDLLRMTEAIVGFMANNPTLRSPALDRSYRMWLIDEFSTQTRPNLSDLHSAQARFMLMDVLAWKRPTTSEVAVKQLKFDESGFDPDAGRRTIKVTVPPTY